MKRWEPLKWVLPKRNSSLLSMPGEIQILPSTMRWWDIDSCVKETVKKRITTENHGIRFMYESGEMVIIPEQAEVVKEIFAGCLAGKSTHIIANELNEKGVPTKKGAKWTGGTINGILTNEKYIGDALFQKTITDASFKRKRNYGEEEQYYCEDHHEPIIDRETFEKAKEAIRQRGLEKGNCTEDTSKYQNRYAMSGKIKCGECGRSFKRRYHYTSHGKSYNAWCCGGHLEDSKSCSMKFIRDDDLKRTFLTMMNKLVFGNDLVLKPLLISITTNNSKKNANSVEDIEKEMKSNEEQRRTIADGLMADGIPTATENKKWRGDGIRKILTNEKYMGDALLQKTYTVDVLTKK